MARRRFTLGLLQSLFAVALAVAFLTKGWGEPASALAGC
jgi:hypothetical protein